MNKRIRIAVLLSILGIVLFWTLEKYPCSDDGFLPDGRYVFTCSKLYTGLCDITLNNGQYRMRPIEKNKRGFVDFKRSWTGRLKIAQSGMGTCEYAITLNGSAKRLIDGSFTGRMRLAYYAIPFIPGRIYWAKWSLRPATCQEIHAGFLNGLKIASSSFILERQRSLGRAKREKTEWSEEELITQSLHKGEDEGYSYSDIRQLLQWYNEGILIVVSNQFVLTENAVLKTP